MDTGTGASQDSEKSCIYEDEYPYFDPKDYTCAIAGPMRVNKRAVKLDVDTEMGGLTDAEKQQEQRQPLIADNNATNNDNGNDHYDPKQKPFDGPVSDKRPQYFLQVLDFSQCQVHPAPIVASMIPPPW